MTAPTSHGESTRVPVSVSQLVALQVLADCGKESVAEVGGGEAAGVARLAGPELVMVLEVLPVEDMLGGRPGSGSAQLGEVVVVMMTLLLLPLLLLLLWSDSPTTLLQHVVNTGTAQQRPPATALSDKSLALSLSRAPGTPGAESTPDALSPRHDLPADLRQETPDTAG